MTMDPSLAAQAPRPSTLSIVLPALNEEGNIAGALVASSRAAERVFDDYEIIVVNDGSTDRTQEIVETHQRANPHIRILSHPSPRGFGRSYDTGRREARMTYCVMVHGDDAFGEETLVRFFSHAGSRDVILGYIENPESRSLTRRIISSAFTHLLNFLFGLRLPYFNGLQIHRTDWLRGVEVKSSGFAFQAELLIQALRTGRTFMAVGTSHRERPGGGKTKIFKPRNIVSVVRTIFDLYARPAGRGPG